MPDGTEADALKGNNDAVSVASVKVEVRAVSLKAMREKRGLTQRKLAHDLGISQN